jgi:hypothetical protein
LIIGSATNFVTNLQTCCVRLSALRVRVEECWIRRDSRLFCAKSSWAGQCHISPIFVFKLTVSLSFANCFYTSLSYFVTSSENGCWA